MQISFVNFNDFKMSFKFAARFSALKNKYRTNVQNQNISKSFTIILYSSNKKT